LLVDQPWVRVAPRVRQFDRRIRSVKSPIKRRLAQFGSPSGGDPREAPLVNHLAEASTTTAPVK